MPPLCRTKHNRAKPMFELPSAMFLIADGKEFRFARFYIVCEEVPLGTPESPPIVSGVSDMHPSDCPNVEETRNPMQTFSRKKCSHFSPTNIPFAFPHEIPKLCFLVILLIALKSAMLIAAIPLKIKFEYFHWQTEKLLVLLSMRHGAEQYHIVR